MQAPPPPFCTIVLRFKRHPNQRTTLYGDGENWQSDGTLGQVLTTTNQPRHEGGWMAVYRIYYISHQSDCCSHDLLCRKLDDSTVSASHPEIPSIIAWRVLIISCSSYRIRMTPKGENGKQDSTSTALMSRTFPVLLQLLRYDLLGGFLDFFWWAAYIDTCGVPF